MRRMAAFLFAGLLLACQSASNHPDAVKQYRAWCWFESKPLGSWVLDRAVAEAQVKKHKRHWPHHSATVKVWTGPTEKTGAK